MGQNVALLTTSDKLHSYYIQKNEQNSLKGVLWGASGSALMGGALVLTAAAAGAIGFSALTTFGVLLNDHARNWVGAAYIPAVFIVTGAAAAIDYVALKTTGYCFKNAIYHFGPEYQIKRSNNFAGV